MSEYQTDHNSIDRKFSKMNIEEKILSRSSRLNVPGGKTREEALKEFKLKVEFRDASTTTEARKSIRMVWWLSSVAAGILIIFGLLQLAAVLSSTSVHSARGSHTQYVLPDGSEVQLNAESRLSYKKKKFSSVRSVNLEGEAFLNVTKGGKFRIFTPKGEIEVLGTSFNVFSRDNSFRVTCITGKVMVISHNQSVSIEQGESAELSSNSLKSYRDVKLHQVTGWINGEFFFENAPLDLVLDEIERQFNVKFAERTRKERFFTGSFLNKDLKTALEIVCITMDLDFEINRNGRISVFSKK